MSKLNDYIKNINKLKISESSKNKIKNQISNIVELYNIYDDRIIKEFNSVSKDIENYIISRIKDIIINHDLEEGKLSDRKDIIESVSNIYAVQEYFTNRMNTQRSSYLMQQYNFSEDKISSLNSSLNADYELDNANRYIENEFMGKTDDERLLSHAITALTKIKLDFNKFFDKKISYKELTSKIKETMYLYDYRFKVLAKDSISRISNNVSKDFYKKNNFEYFMLCAVMDYSTCDDCSNLDGSVYTFDDYPTLPFHVGCRCELVSIDKVDYDLMKEV